MSCRHSQCQQYAGCQYQGNDPLIPIRDARIPELEAKIKTLESELKHVRAENQDKAILDIGLLTNKVEATEAKLAEVQELSDLRFRDEQQARWKLLEALRLGDELAPWVGGEISHPKAEQDYRAWQAFRADNGAVGGREGLK